MPVLVIKFPEDNARKVNMSRFLSKYTKREFSVIVDVERERLPHIFEILNRNECKVLMAQDQSLIIDFEMFLILFIIDSKLKMESKVIISEEKDLEEESEKKEKVPIKNINEAVFGMLEGEDSLKKLLEKFKKHSNIYLTRFEKDYIITKDQALFQDWSYRLRVLFDSITISAIELNQKLEELEKISQLDNRFKFLYVLNLGYNTLGDIANFIGLQDFEEFEELEKLINNQIIYKNPYRLSEIGTIIINFIDDNLKKKILYKFKGNKENFLNEITNNDYARQLVNLLIELCLLTIENRKVTGYIKDFKEFQNLEVDLKEYQVS